MKHRSCSIDFDFLQNQRYASTTAYPIKDRNITIECSNKKQAEILCYCHETVAEITWQEVPQSHMVSIFEKILKLSILILISSMIAQMTASLKNPQKCMLKIAGSDEENL